MAEERNQPFRRVVIVGLGLIGGSIAAAAKRLPQPPEIRAVDVDAEGIGWAIANDLVTAGLDPDSASRAGWYGPGAADLIVVATPARFAEECFRTIALAGFDGVVTDVASTKSAVVSSGERLFASTPATFVGGHPMAGSEKSGVTASSATLFDGAYYVLTPTRTTDTQAFGRLHAFVTSLGARVVSVDPAVHDEAVAVVSHVPHVAAAALITLALRHVHGGEDVLRLAAGGFKDMTRIAAGSPQLWTGICLDNGPALVQGLRELSEVLDDFTQRVEASDAAGVDAWLTEAADVRRGLPARYVPAVTSLMEITLPVADRPGVVSDVTTAVSRAGCNIEDISIDHLSEDTALLRLLVTDEGDLMALVADLEARGFEPSARPL